MSLESEMAARVGRREERLAARRSRAESLVERYLRPPERERGCSEVSVQDGVILVASDCHHWPESKVAIPTAHRALVHMCTALKPSVVVLNGDIVDGARISRYAMNQWHDLAALPTVVEEIAVAQARLREIREAVPDAELIWTLGNHDSRMERYLIEAAPEMAGVHGTRLKDHFPDWLPAMEVRVNPDTDCMVQIKHRMKSGEYAPRNNTMKAGVSVVTGHLHSQKVMPWSDLRGTRWGVDAGMIAAPYGPQFYAYTEGNQVDWRSGFAVLTFGGGLLLPPELVTVFDEAAGLVTFRGEVIAV